MLLVVKLNLTSCTERIIFRSCWQSQTSSLAMMLQKCTTILVLSLWLKSRPRDLVSGHQKFFFHQMTSIHRVNAHIDSPSVTTCLLFGSLSSILRPCYMVKIAIPWLDKIPLWQNSNFLHFLIKNHQPYLTDSYRHATVWSLSLKPIVLNLVGQTCSHLSFRHPWNL
jgi:hypothetical protein